MLVTDAMSRAIVVLAALCLALLSSLPLSARERLSGPTDFELNAADEKIIRLSDYRGQWIVVNFWATWCPPCLEEIPDLIKFHKVHQGEGAMVLGVNFEELDPFLLEHFIAEHDIIYPNGQAGNVPLVPFEPLLGLPTTFLVDPQGRLVKRHTGPINFEWLEKALVGARTP